MMKSTLFAISMLATAVSAQAADFDVGGIATKVVNSGAMSSFTQTLQKQTPQVQAPQAKKVQQSAQNQQPKSELSAAGDQVLGGIGGLANGAGDVIGGTAKAGVAAVKTVASGIGGFFSSITNQTPEFTVPNYQKIIEGIDSSSKTDIVRKTIDSKVNGKKISVQTETYVLQVDSVKYGLTVASNNQAVLETVGNPKLKSADNEHGYGKIELNPQDAQNLKNTFVQNMRTDPEAKKANAPTTNVPSWGSNSYGG